MEGCVEQKLIGGEQELEVVVGSQWLRSVVTTLLLEQGAVFLPF